MKISNVKIYDFEESIVASGLPMMAEYSEQWIVNEIINLRNCEDITENPHFKRAIKLANTPPGSGHSNYLSGIVVSMDVTATQVWWMQMERYHFVQIVSSQSKMHRLRQMMNWHDEIGAESCFHKKVFENGVTLLKDLAADESGEFDDADLAYNCPMGFELTARITTNYLQLKTIWNQRHNHKLEEWKDFCGRIECLPFAKEFIIGGDK